MFVTKGQWTSFRDKASVSEPHTWQARGVASTNAIRGDEFDVNIGINPLAGSYIRNGDLCVQCLM